MNELSVFKMSAEELQELLKPMADAIKEKAWSNNGYISYYDPQICPDTNFMIREYRDRKELAQLNESGVATYPHNLICCSIYTHKHLAV
jgi:hypothetical protein